MKYRIQKQDEAGRWETLALRDYSITRDSEARAIVNHFTKSTGQSYRAQKQAGRLWIPVEII